MADGTNNPPQPPAREPSSASFRNVTRPRRHSLPASTADLPTLALLHRNETENTVTSTLPPADPVMEVHYNPPAKSRKKSHKSSKSNSQVLDQPVLVRSYSPRPQSSLGMAADELEDEMVRVELPPIEAFSFSGILKAVEPKVARTLETVSLLSSNYRSNLAHETSLLETTQKDIDSKMQRVDRLSSQVLRTTTTRHNRLKTDVSMFKGGAVVQDLAQSAEKAYATIDSIISTLQAIDAMLPPQEQLSTIDSLHQKHYPYTHSLLASKAAELRPHRQTLYSQSRAVLSPTTVVERGVGEGSTSQDVTSWSGSRRNSSYFPSLSAYGSPLSTQQRQINTPPIPKLKIVEPNVVAEDSPIATPIVISPSLHSSLNKSYMSGAAAAAGGRNSVNIAASVAVSARSSFSLRNIFWGSSSLWRKQSVGSASAGGSVGRGMGINDTAEAKLKKIIELQGQKKDGSNSTGIGS